MATKRTTTRYRDTFRLLLRFAGGKDRHGTVGAAPRGHSPNRPAETGGRPPRHGRRFKCSDRRTWGKPDDSLVASDPRYGTVSVQAWNGLHPKLTRTWALVGSRDHPDRQGLRDPRRGRAPAQAHVVHEEDALAVLVGTRRARPRSDLACLPTSLRY